MKKEEEIQIKKVILDLDDTLFNTKVDRMVVPELFLSKYKFNCTAEQLCETISDIDYMEDPTYEKFYEFLKRYLGENLNQEIFDDYTKIAIENVTLISERTEEVLKYLSEKYELIVLTNWFYKCQIGKLDKLGLTKYFDKIYSFDTIGKKPELDVMQKACAPYNLNECVMIGDNMIADVLVPKKLGLRSIYLGESQDVESVSKLEDLLDIL